MRLVLSFDQLCLLAETWECILNNVSYFNKKYISYCLPNAISKLRPSLLHCCQNALLPSTTFCNIFQVQMQLWVHPKCRCAVRLTACSNLQCHNARITYQLSYSGLFVCKNAFNFKHLSKASASAAQNAALRTAAKPHAAQSCWTLYRVSSTGCTHCRRWLFCYYVNSVLQQQYPFNFLIPCSFPCYSLLSNLLYSTYEISLYMT